jgi:hypothetical protein
MQHGKSLQPSSVKICVLYDPKDGRIVHTHRVFTLPGARMATDEEVEERAKTRATQAGHSVSGLSTLHVAAEDYNASNVYSVDLAKKQLVKHEPPEELRLRYGFGKRGSVREFL